MGDPLSIPAGVVGMLSLAIQVCQGLYKYCSAVKDRTRDIENALAQIHGLETTFRALAGILHRIESNPRRSLTAVATVNQCISDCEQGVQQLHDLLKSISDTPQHGFRGKAKGVGKKLAFGLRQEELSKLQQKVHALSATANLALQTLTL